MTASGHAARGGAPAIVWFRDDLRISDHPALATPAKAGQPVICVYVLDETSPGLRKLGGAARWWLAGSLRALDRSLRDLGGALVLRRGAAGSVIPDLVAATGSREIYINRRHDKVGADIDDAVEERLREVGAEVIQFQANLLHDPREVRTNAGLPFRVFTPFWRCLRAMGEPRMPIAAPPRINGAGEIDSDSLSSWQLEPTHPDWAAGLRDSWTRGEAGAQSRLSTFLDHGIAGYAGLRDRPDLDNTSRLSPHLRFGEISPFQIWHSCRLALNAHGKIRATDIDKLLSELAWREFCWHLLHHYPDLATRNFNPRFDTFRWRTDDKALSAWQRGRTGYPIVDAGMRQLWTTGWMHNRVRMITASFLIKHLLIDWRAGEQWFWDTLVDADIANNPANWQWVAGSGADAAPYFRIFNPILQGEKFDPQGDYVRRFVPELARLPDAALQAPFTAAPLELASAGVTLGESYPKPLVEHKAARARALAALATLKQSNE